MNYNRMYLLLKLANKQGAIKALKPYLNFSEEENNSIINLLETFSDKDAPKIVGAVLKEIKYKPNISCLKILQLIDSKKKVVPSVIEPANKPVKINILNNLLSNNTDKYKILEYCSNLSYDLIKLVENFIINNPSINIFDIKENIENIKALPNKYQKWLVNRFSSEAKKSEIHPIEDCFSSLKEYSESEAHILYLYENNINFNEKVQELLINSSIKNIDSLSLDDMNSVLNTYKDFLGISELTVTKDPKKLTNLPLEDKIGEFNEWELWLPSSKENSCAIARVDENLNPKTTWCTARTKSSNLFYNYIGGSDGNLILYYVIKKNPSEDNDWISIGYFRNKIFYGGDGQASVNRANKGIRDSNQLKQILGSSFNDIVNTITKKSNELNGVSPALQKINDAATNPKLYLDMISSNTKEEAKSLTLSILKRQPSLEVLNEILKKSRDDDDEILKSVVSSNNANVDILNKVLEKTNNEYIIEYVISNKNADQSTLNKILEKTNDIDIIKSVALNKNADQNIFNKILKKTNDESIIKYVISNENVDQNILHNILEKTDSENIVNAIAYKKYNTTKVLDLILKKTNNKQIITQVIYSAFSLNNFNFLNKILKETNNNNIIIEIAYRGDAEMISKVLEKTNNEDILFFILINPNANLDVLNKTLEKINSHSVLQKIINTNSNKYIFSKILEKINNKSTNLNEKDKKLKKILDTKLMLAIANNKKSDSDILKNIFEKGYNKQVVLSQVCLNPNTSSDILDKILEKSKNLNFNPYKSYDEYGVAFINNYNKMTIMNIIKNPNVSKNTLKKILQQINNKSILYAAKARFDSFDEYQKKENNLKEAAKNSDLYLKLIKNNNFDNVLKLNNSILDKNPSEEVLNTMIDFNKDNLSILTSIINNPNANEKTFSKIIEKTNNINILKEIILSKNVTLNILNKILEKTNNYLVLKNLATSKKVTTDILNSIIDKIEKSKINTFETRPNNQYNDDDDYNDNYENFFNFKEIILAIIENPKTSEEILINILKKINKKDLLNNAKNKLNSLKLNKEQEQEQEQNKIAMLFEKLNFFYKTAGIKNI